MKPLRKPVNSPVPASAAPPGDLVSPALVEDVRQLILTTREKVARTVNAGLVMLYWRIG